MPDYYNYHHRLGNDSQIRRSFMAHLWGAHKNDPHWVPPEYQVMRAAVMAPHPHINRQQPVFIQSHAIRRQHQENTRSDDWFGRDTIDIASIQEETVGLGVALYDPRRTDQTAYLACLHTANQPDCLEQLLSALMEESYSYGCQRIIGPVGFSLHLGGGLLVDHWRETPPLYTSYDPPYMAETVLSIMKPLQTSHLYHLQVPKELLEVHGPSELVRADPNDLMSELLHLFQAAVRINSLAAELDVLEADFLLQWIDNWPTHFWLAKVQGQPAGFVLLQPDLAPLLQQANGGRWPWWRIWLRRAARRPVRAGRILFGGVLPEAQGRGLGSQLLAKSLQIAQEMDWERLSIGPIPANSRAAQFLSSRAGQPRQTYQYFEWP